jgi:flagellar L-ring protein precursor FlgH
MKVFAAMSIAVSLLVLGACASARPAGQRYAATAPEPLPPVASANGAIYQAGHDVPLFENSVAHRVGDILTILLSERTDASKSATTNTAKSSKLALPGPTIAGLPVTISGTEILNTSLDNNSTFGGSGDSAQSNALSGYVTVTVAQRLPNGNLLVRGEKNIMINQGTEFVRIEGVVRAVDISPANTVQSYKVANASISYGSRGAINSANSKSWLARFFDSKWMPF